jgi:predicted nucleotidyltransferase
MRVFFIILPMDELVNYALLCLILPFLTTLQKRICCGKIGLKASNFLVCTNCFARRHMRREEALHRLKANTEKFKLFSVQQLAIFGSVARDEARPDSDIDILVEFDPHVRVGLFAFVRLQRLLSEIMGCQVDLVTLAALRKELREQILQEAIYAA